jgi:hypothetical protein
MNDFHANLVIDLGVHVANTALESVVSSIDQRCRSLGEPGLRDAALAVAAAGLIAKAEALALIALDDQQHSSFLTMLGEYRKAASRVAERMS